LKTLWLVSVAQPNRRVAQSFLVRWPSPQSTFVRWVECRQVWTPRRCTSVRQRTSEPVPVWNDPLPA